MSACTIRAIDFYCCCAVPQVIVASVGTAVNCIPQLTQCNFSLVIVDEAHHSVASTYKTVLRGLGFVEELAAPSTSSSSSSDVAEGLVPSEDASLLSERRREWKKQYAESGIEPDDAVLGEDLQTDQYADAPTFASSSSSSIDSSQEESSQELVAETAAAEPDGSSSSSSSSSSMGGSQQLVMRAVANPNSLCVGFTATPYR
jgi:hypothetical protein